MPTINFLLRSLARRFAEFIARNLTGVRSSLDRVAHVSPPAQEQFPAPTSGGLAPSGTAPAADPAPTGSHPVAWVGRQAFRSVVAGGPSVAFKIAQAAARIEADGLGGGKGTFRLTLGYLPPARGLIVLIHAFSGRS